MPRVALYERYENSKNIEWDETVSSRDDARKILASDMARTASEEMANALLNQWDANSDKDAFEISYPNGEMSTTVVIYQD